MTHPDRADENMARPGDRVAHDGGDGGDGGELTIRQVAQLLNVPAPTIRSWERRYGVPVAGRSSGGHRRYGRVQIDQLLAMRDLVARGRRPAEAAPLVRSGHATSPQPYVQAFLKAANELAPGGIARTLDSARQALGLDDTIDEVLMPAMREVGEWWHAGRIDVSHEHLATIATQAWLATVTPPGPLSPQPQSHSPIVLSCGPLDHHTLALEALGALLRVRGWDCRMLGARTPAESLAHAVAETDAVAVVVVSHVTNGRRAAIDALRSTQLRQRALFYAGGAFTSARARHEVPGSYLGTNITRAAELITATLISPPTG